MTRDILLGLQSFSPDIVHRHSSLSRWGCAAGCGRTTTGELYGGALGRTETTGKEEGRMQNHSAALDKKKSASKKSKLDKSSVVTVADGKEWLANKPFEKTPIQRTSSSDSTESLNSKLQGTVEARKKWLTSAFADGGASTDSFDSSHQWEASIRGTQPTDFLNTSESDASEPDESIVGSLEASLSHASSSSLAECGIQVIVRDDSNAFQQEQVVDFGSTPRNDSGAPLDEDRSNDSGLTTNHYSQERVCAIVVQAALRGYLFRRCLHRQKEAAIKIEAQVRRGQAQYTYELKIFAVVLLQAWIRGWLVRRRRERAHAAAVLQAVARGWLARSCLERAFAVVLVQSVIRGCLARRRFQHATRNLLHQQAAIIQARWRSYQAQAMYELRAFAIVFLQATMRGSLVRRRVAKSRAAVLVQSTFRGWRAHRQMVFVSLQDREKASAILIQTQWRRYQAESMFELQCFAAVLLQSVFRVFLVQKGIEKTYAAALIQSLVRGWLVRRRLEHTLAAVFLQSVARGWLTRRHLIAQRAEERSIVERDRLRELSITLIQSHWRRFQAQSMYELRSLAIVVVQSVVRVFLVQKGLEKTFAAALLQSVVRGWLARRRLEQAFAAAFLQSVARGWLTRRRLKAQQEEERSERDRLHKLSIILIQSQWRRFQAQSIYELQSLAIVVVQSVVRVFLVQKGLEKTFAAALLQSVVRGWLTRRRLEKTFASALIQSVGRGWLARNQLPTLRQREVTLLENRRRREAAALLIQVSWRRCEARSLYKLQLRAVIVIQSVVRVFAVLKQLEKTFAAALLQSVIRGWLERRQLENRVTAVCEARRRVLSAVVIQRQWRMYRAQAMYELQTYAIVFLQSVIRGYQERRAMQSLRVAVPVKERQFSAAILIQARWRGSIEKEAYHFYKLMVKSVMVVQAAWRQYKMRKARIWRTPSSSSYSSESVTPSSPSSVTVFTSGEYSAAHAQSEVSATQRHDIRSALVVPNQRRESARITLDMSNPKSRLAPILTCFGSVQGSPNSRATSQDLIDAAATIQRPWRASIDRQLYQQKLTAIGALQSFSRRAFSFHSQQQVSAIDFEDLTPTTGAQIAHRRPVHAVQELCRSPSRDVARLRRRSLLQSLRAPVLTWF